MKHTKPIMNKSLADLIAVVLPAAEAWFTPTELTALQELIRRAMQREANQGDRK
jgi:hypothetical protein